MRDNGMLCGTTHHTPVIAPPYCLRCRMRAWAWPSTPAKARTHVEPAAHHASAGACESHDTITIASMPSRRTFGATVTGRRLPARFGQPELRKQAMSMTRRLSLGLLGGVRCRDARKPTGGHADGATRRGTRCGDTSVHCRGTSAIPGAGRGPVAGYAACGRVQGLHGCSRLSAVRLVASSIKQSHAGLLYHPRQAER